MPFPDELASVAGEINATFILNDVQRRELARLAAVAEVTQSAVIVTDPAGAIEWVNASFGRLLGRKLYEVRGQFVLLGLHPAPGQHAVALELWKSLAEKGAVNGELTVLAEDGREVALNLEAQQVLGLEQYVLLCEDITEKRQLERQVLMAASRASEELALGLHDIVGGDLGGLAFQAKVLAEQLDRAGRPEAATARTLIVSLNQLSKRTRAMSHLLAPAMPDTGGLAQALRNMANAAATYCDAYVSTRMPDVVPALEGWRQQQVYLIAQEAVRNAVNHGPPTQLAIAVEEHGARLDVRVLSKGTAWKPSASAEGLGLHAMRYRARLLDASLRVRTSSAGWTLIAFSVPLPAATGSLPTIGDTARWRQLA